MMRTEFKNRGHFCNYCRKIVWNKTKDRALASPNGYPTLNINEAIWAVWNSGDPILMDTFLQDLSSLELKDKAKEFNNQLRALKKKYVKDECK